MLSVNSNQVQSAQVQIKSHTELSSTVDYSLYFNGMFIGSIDKFPVWGLDANFDLMLQAGLKKTDSCFMVGTQPYATLELATAHLVASFLAKSGRLDRSN